MTTSSFLITALLQCAASVVAAWTVRRVNPFLLAVYLWSLLTNIIVFAAPGTWSSDACVAYEFVSCALIALAAISTVVTTFDWEFAGKLAVPVIIAGPIALLTLSKPPCEQHLWIVPLVGLTAVVCATALRSPWLVGVQRTAIAWLGWACVTRVLVALAPQAVVDPWQHVATMVWVVGCAAVAWRGWRG